MLTSQAWHERFQQQARWTEPVRRFLFSELGLGALSRGLEAGCGTGVITGEVQRWGARQVFGIDLNADFLRIARGHAPGIPVCQADAFHLPFAPAAFDFTFCHYFLLWLAQPESVLREMRRVTRPGGPVLLMAEPDYGGRIDYPESLVELGELQSQSLRRQGADPQVGRKLASLLASTGLRQVRSGVLGGQWSWLFDENEWDSEWKVLRSDLAGQVPERSMADYQARDQAARQSGRRILYIPTFYAWGVV